MSRVRPLAVIWFFSERFVVDCQLEARTCKVGSTLPVSYPSTRTDLISLVSSLVMTSKSCYRFCAMMFRVSEFS
jgi:hypothetical protein